MNADEGDGGPWGTDGPDDGPAGPGGGPFDGD